MEDATGQPTERRGRRVWGIILIIGLVVTALVAPSAAAKGKKDGAEASTASTDTADTGATAKDEPTCIDGGTDAAAVTGSLYSINRIIGAHEAWSRGVTGGGVDVAVIDTGVVPVHGLHGQGKVVHGPDLSFEAGVEAARHLDTFGHGTHIAGIIAGDDLDSSEVAEQRTTVPAGDAIDPGVFRGVAPDARLVNIKVGDNTGAVDVSQVIAAIDWAVQHRRTGGLNIRVINLSYRVAGTQPYEIDPLARAVENAWDHGIVVVAAAGNDAKADELGNPARDPYVIAVGSVTEENSQANKKDSTEGTSTHCLGDELKFKASKFASSADDSVSRHPDIYAPGTTVLSLRNPGSRADVDHPGSRVDDRFARATGTSQAAAIVSGSVALLLDARPELTPDEVKAVLTGSALTVEDAGVDTPAVKLVQIDAALDLPVPADAVQSWPRSDGSGTLDGARGADIVVVDGVALTGEITAFGGDWDANAWVASSTAGASWSGSSWSGNSWSGSSWSGSSWSGSSWSGNSWSGSSWSGSSWSGSSWSGATWN